MNIPVEIFQMSAEANEAWHELVNQTERAIGVLGGAIIEEALDEALTCRWRVEVKRKKDTTVREQLESSGHFTFSMKIHLAYLTNLIGTLVKKDLDQIRHIRNRFAHRTRSDDSKHWEPVTFGMGEIQSRCGKIKLIDRVKIVIDDQHLNTETPKDRFLAAVSLYSQVFSLYTRNPLEPHKHAAELLQTDLPI